MMGALVCPDQVSYGQICYGRFLAVALFATALCAPPLDASAQKAQVRENAETLKRTQQELQKAREEKRSLSEQREVLAKELQDLLLEEAGVASLAGTAFGAEGEGYLRFSYANSVENIERAFDRIRECFAKLS